MAMQCRRRSPPHGVLLLGILAIYYVWLIMRTGESGENSLHATDKLLAQLDFVSPDHFESGDRGEEFQIHPFDEPRAREIKTQLHRNASAMDKGAGAKRRANLRHSWADDDLFQTAIKSDRQAQRQVATRGYTRANGRGKIAFMFLVERDLPLEPLWARFLHGHGDRYNIYVHCSSTFQIGILKGVFSGRAIPSTVVQPNTPDFIAAARRLMANAILHDPANEWFALLSDACIPLHSFDHIHKTLESSNRSFVEINSKKFPRLWYRYVARGVHSLEPDVSWADFKMGSKWWIMRKKHALMMVDDRMYWNKFSQPCLRQHKVCAPEEHYFSTVLSILDRNGSTGKAVTFQNDRDGLESDTPSTFRCSQIDGPFFSRLQSKDKGQWLFAQRFSAICLDQLLATTRTIYNTQKVEIEDMGG